MGSEMCIRDRSNSNLASAQASLEIAGPPAENTATFDGCIENPHLYAGVLSDAEIEATRTSADQSSVPIFAFAFAEAISTSQIHDAGPHKLKGTLINHPTRAVRASRWTGREMCFRHAPGEYGAIHFLSLIHI